MEETELTFTETFKTFKSKISNLFEEIISSDATKEQKKSMMDPLNEISFISGTLIGTIARHEDVSKKLSIKVDDTVKIIEESLVNTAMESETKLVLETELFVLRNVLNELKKIGWE